MTPPTSNLQLAPPRIAPLSSTGHQHAYRRDGAMRALRVDGRRTGVLSPDEGSLDLYLHEIGQYPLLSREEECELSARSRAGDEAAFDTLVRSNLRFVVAVAKRYQNQGVSLADLINEGNLGLIRAAQKFDERRGNKFISYAVWWVRQTMLQALADQARIVRVPLNRAGEFHRIGRRTAALQQELGREPTAAEVAEGLGIDLRTVEETMVISQWHLSFDAPATTGNTMRLSDHLADEEGRGPDADAIEHALTDRVAQSVGELGPREAHILRLYFGLDGADPLTLEDIGAALGITRERVRQIKEKALRRLRDAADVHALESFLS